MEVSADWVARRAVCAVSGVTMDRLDKMKDVSGYEKMRVPGEHHRGKPHRCYLHLDDMFSATDYGWDTFQASVKRFMECVKSEPG